MTTRLKVVAITGSAISAVAARAAELKLQAWVVKDRVQEIIDSRYKGNRARCPALSPSIAANLSRFIAATELGAGSAPS